MDRTRLQHAIDHEVLSADRPELLRRLAAAGDHDLAGLVREVERSAARRRARLGALPVPRLDASLPVAASGAEIAMAIRDHRVVVLCGETGSGKTTQLPLICLGLGRGAAGMIAHTQPRRIAARAVAARIAQQLGVPVGGAVGVKVRFSDQTSPATAVKLMTDGMLLAESRADPDLSAYDTIIIDEAHERSLNIDFLLGYLHRLLPRRPDLRVIITSATIDPQRFATFFSNAGTVPVLNISGRTYPVEVRYRPDDDDDPAHPDAVADAVRDLARPGAPAGDVLVFLPGEREIRLCADAIRRGGTDLEVLPLFARMPAQDQDRIFSSRAGTRRVILATNVAETSITVPGVRFVVDTGLARISRYDPRAKVRRLPVEPVSQAAAMQRSGRCGRVAAGVAVRLYSKQSFRERPVFTQPEILRTDLAGVLLQMASLELGDPAEFPFIDPPEARAIADARETLFELGAFDSPGPAARITPLGQRLARLPLDPRTGRMLLAAHDEGVLSPVLVLAAALSIQDPRERPAAAASRADQAHEVFRDPTSDFLTLLRLWEQYQHAADTLGPGGLREWCRDHFVSHTRMREWGDTWRQLRDAARDEELDGGAGGPRSFDPDAIHRALLAGLICNICCRDEALGPHQYRGFRGNSVSIFPGSVLFKQNPRWFVAAEIVETTRLYARTLARIDPEWVERVASHVLQRQVSDKHLDHATCEPRAWERVSLAGVVIVPRRSIPLAPIDPAGARRLFIREALATGLAGGDAPFAVHNRAVLAAADAAQHVLRRHRLARPVEELAAWFEARLPPGVCDPASLREHLERGGSDAHLRLSHADVLPPDANPDPSLFPGSLGLDGVTLPLEYLFEPGSEADGVTARVKLLDLPLLTPERAHWLIPGWLDAKVAALVKALPKADRAALEARGPVARVAADLAAVLTFGRGPLPGALSEAASVLYSLTIEPKAWPLSAVPEHLRLRVVVTDDAGHEITHGRDIDELHQRLAPRLAKARAALARARFERTGILAWDFGDLPDGPASPGPPPAYASLVDDGGSVRLTLMADHRLAGVATSLGVRRLFAIACGEEVRARLIATPNWGEIEKWHSALGSAEALADAAVCLVCEKCFLTGQAGVRSRDDFDARLQGAWGRLGQASIEVADLLARTLEPRFKVARRISGGTSRHWAASIADLREHAAYLMPRGFLAQVPFERFREYPRYAGGMWERILALREDGSGAEHEALRTIAPLWKQFTGWIAAAAARKSADTAPDQPEASPPPRGKAGKAPLPQARRAAPAVNLDAGEWAMARGRLPPPVEAYRWALEDLRVAMFAPHLGGPRVTASQVASLWEQARTAAAP